MRLYCLLDDVTGLAQQVFIFSFYFFLYRDITVYFAQQNLALAKRRNYRKTKCRNVKLFPWLQFNYIFFTCENNQYNVCLSFLRDQDCRNHIIFYHMSGSHFAESVKSFYTFQLLFLLNL